MKFNKNRLRAYQTFQFLKISLTSNPSFNASRRFIENVFESHETREKKEPEHRYQKKQHIP